MIIVTFPKHFGSSFRHRTNAGFKSVIRAEKLSAVSCKRPVDGDLFAASDVLAVDPSVPPLLLMPNLQSVMIPYVKMVRSV